MPEGIQKKQLGGLVLFLRGLIRGVKPASKNLTDKEIIDAIKGLDRDTYRKQVQESTKKLIDRISNGEIPITVEEESLTPALRVAQRANRDKIWTSAAERNAKGIEEYRRLFPNYNPNEPVASIDIDDALILDIMRNSKKYEEYPWMIDRAKALWGTLDNGEFLPF